MPVYEAKCRKCGAILSFVATVAECDDTPTCCGERAQKILSRPAALIIDNTRYVTAAADLDGKRKVITSKRDHREFLRRNGLVEVGTERLSKPSAPVLDNPKQDIIDAYNQTVGGL